MALEFRKATKTNSKLRLALIGAAGSGKTFTALSIAQHLEGPVALIDTERGSASKYSDHFEFDVLELEVFSPQMYVEAIQAAEEAGYKTLIIDSLSHAWTGKDGALDQVSRAARRAQSNNTFGAWRDVTPLHNAMVDAIINTRMHVIATMRAKTDYVQEKDEKTGKTTVRKVGLAPVQRDGLEYEFDVVGDLDQDNNLIIGKTRCPSLAGAVFRKAGKDVASKLTAWLSGSTPASRNGIHTNGAGTNGTPAGFARSKPVAPPVPEPARAVEEDDPYADDDVLLCHCGIEAKYVRGKKASGWVCGYHGTEGVKCNFRLKDDAVEELADDPFQDGEAAPAQTEKVAV